MDDTRRSAFSSYGRENIVSNVGKIFFRNPFLSLEGKSWSGISIQVNGIQVGVAEYNITSTDSGISSVNCEHNATSTETSCMLFNSNEDLLQTFTKSGIELVNNSFRVKVLSAFKTDGVFTYSYGSVNSFVFP